MFKFIWRIENLSVLCESGIKFLDSPTFEVESLDNVKVYVRLYTSTVPLVNGYFRNYSLHMANESSTFKLGTKVRLSFTKNNKSSEFKEFEVLSDTMSILHLSSQTSLIQQIKTLRELFSSEDSVQVECVFLKPNYRDLTFPVTCCANSVVQIERHTYGLSLSEFNLNTNRHQHVDYSKTFCGEKHSDSFELTLGVHEDSKTSTVEIRKMCKNDSAVLVCCRVSLFSAANTLSNFLCGSHLFEEGSGNELWNCGNLRLHPITMRGFSTLRCEIIVSKGTTASTLGNGSQLTAETANKKLGKYNLGINLPSTKKTPTDLVSIKSDKNGYTTVLKSMYENLEFSDMILQVGTDQFPAHKCVLSSVSDVFSTMFKTKMKEEETNVVNVTDIEKDIIGKMLQFVYTGEVENLDLHALTKLFFASDKYQILELKKLCSLHLKESLTTDNCLDVLELADMHQDSDLVDAARNFIYDNRKEILDSDGWKSFMVKRIELAADIMFHICKRS